MKLPALFSKRIDRISSFENQFLDIETIMPAVCFILALDDFHLWIILEFCSCYRIIYTVPDWVIQNEELLVSLNPLGSLASRMDVIIILSISMKNKQEQTREEIFFFHSTSLLMSHFCLFIVLKNISIMEKSKHM